ncbi:CdaR family protein [Candidatus Omnitrophota bacterium]
MRNIIFNNFWAKIIAFALAVATWFYVFDVVNKDGFPQKKETVEDVFSRYRFVVKEVPIKPVFYGKSPEGYQVVFDKVKLEPSKISIFGPEDIIQNVEELSTDKVNLSEYTRSVQLKLGVHSNVRMFDLEDQIVDLYLPIKVTTKGAKKVSEVKETPGGES